MVEQHRVRSRVWVSVWRIELFKRKETASKKNLAGCRGFIQAIASRSEVGMMACLPHACIFIPQNISNRRTVSKPLHHPSFSGSLLPEMPNADDKRWYESRLYES